MKRKTSLPLRTFLLSMTMLLLVFVERVGAQSNDDSSGFLNPDYRIPNPSKFDSLEEVISALGALLQPIFIITFVAMILWGAWVNLTSKGDEGKITKSRQIIMAAIIGFAIAVFAPTIVNFVANLLGVDIKLQ